MEATVLMMGVIAMTFRFKTKSPMMRCVVGGVLFLMSIFLVVASIYWIVRGRLGFALVLLVAPGLALLAVLFVRDTLFPRVFWVLDHSIRLTRGNVVIGEFPFDNIERIRELRYGECSNAVLDFLATDGVIGAIGAHYRGENEKPIGIAIVLRSVNNQLTLCPKHSLDRITKTVRLTHDWELPREKMIKELSRHLGRYRLKRGQSAEGVTKDDVVKFGEIRDGDHWEMRG